MIQRRAYGRVMTDTECLIYAKGLEIEAKILNICEEGICFECDTTENSKKLINYFDIISFSGLDVYLHLDVDETTSVLYGEGKIVRYSLSSDKLILGCRLINPSSQLLKYITDKKVNYFVKTWDLTFGSGGF